MSTQLFAHAATDIGCCRDENEDQFLLSSLSRPVVAGHSEDTANHSLVAERTVVMAVADGLGGHQGGAIASELAVHSVGSYVQENEVQIRHSHSNWQLANTVRKAILSAESAIENVASNHSTRSKMATTLTVALIHYPELIIGHVGDSRCYLSRQGKLTQLTSDHTIAQAIREHGKVDSDESINPRFKNMLWNCLGGRRPTVKIETHVVELEPHDWVLLASDGLFGQLSDDIIQNEIEKARVPRHLCNSLKALALEKGGFDNITVLACNWQTSNQEKGSSRPISDQVENESRQTPLSLL